MFRCPHCQQPGVSITGKLFAAPWSPTRCRKCGRPSSEDMVAARTVNGIVGASPFFVLLAAFMLQSWWPVLVFAAFVLVAYPAILVFSPLRPLDSEQVATAKSRRSREVWLILLGLGLLAALGLLLK